MRSAFDVIAEVASRPEVRAVIDRAEKAMRRRPCLCFCSRAHPADRGICEVLDAVITGRYSSDRVNGDRAPWRPGSPASDSLSLHDSAWAQTRPKLQLPKIWGSPGAKVALRRRITDAVPGIRLIRTAPRPGAMTSRWSSPSSAEAPRPRQRQPGPAAEAPIASDIGLGGRSVYCSAADRATDDL
jgi:hypothetical protein